PTMKIVSMLLITMWADYMSELGRTAWGRKYNSHDARDFRERRNAGRMPALPGGAGAEGEIVAPEGGLRAARFDHHGLHGVAADANRTERQADTERSRAGLIVHLGGSNDGR